MDIIRKNPKMTISDNGGFIIEFDKHCMNPTDSYSGMTYVGMSTETFTSSEGDIALKRLIEMTSESKKGMEMAAKAAMLKKMQDEDAD